MNLLELMDEVETISSEMSTILDQRTTNEDTRYCRWDGQSTDGRKHEEDIGDKAMPFEGASDGRIRTADMLINEHVDECVLAACRVVPKVKGIEGTDEYKAGKMGMILKWIKANKWKSDFRTQMELLCQYVEGDTPAVALLKVDWVKERAIEMRDVNVEGLLSLVTEEMAESLTDDTLVDVANMVANPLRKDELTNLLRQLFPNISEKTAGKIANDLQDNKTATFPTPYLRKNYPVMKACRLYDDVFVRSNITDLDRAPVLFEREWLTKTECQERAATEKWNTGFLEKLIGDGVNEKGKETMSAFESNDNLTSDSPSTGLTITEPRKGLYEVLTAYEYRVSEDGVLAIWTTVFSGLINDKTAKEPEIYSRKHGKYPFVLFSRENLTKRKLDSRSVSELVMTHQNAQKLVHDSMFDHVQVMTNPPLKVGYGRTKYQVTLAPFGQIEAGPRENVGFLERPPFPQATQWMSEKLGKDNNEYFGREDEHLPPSLSTLKRQARVERFLDALKEAYLMEIMLIEEFMTDDELARITNKAGFPIARTIEEIQGNYDLELSFDVRDLDSEYIIKKGEFYLNVIKALDTRATVRWEVGVRRLVEAMDPTAADEMVMPSEEADAREAKDERINFAMIVAGMEPEMQEGGMNAQLRLDVLQSEVQNRLKNPGAFYPLSPAADAILQNRIKHLEFQLQQQQNAVTGRTGTEPVNVADVGGVAQ